MNQQSELNAAAQIRQVVGPHAQALLTNTAQGKFLVAVEDLYVGAQLRFTGTYGSGELSLLRPFCRPDTRALVVGAHIGTIAIPLARICAGVVAIEANPETFELLRLNVMINGQQNCRAIHKAASNRHEIIDFVLSRTNTGGSKRNPLIKDPAYFYDNPRIVPVEAAPLDEVLADEAPFDVILMDIEGSEYFALQGMPRILSAAKVLMIEFLPCHLRDVAAVSIQQFIDLLLPHFSSVCIPTRGQIVAREQFLPVMQEMYDRNEYDAGLIFTKFPVEALRVS
jgi:FkbM family methyltransferase